MLSEWILSKKCGKFVSLPKEGFVLSHFFEYLENKIVVPPHQVPLEMAIKN